MKSPDVAFVTCPNCTADLEVKYDLEPASRYGDDVVHVHCTPRCECGRQFDRIELARAIFFTIDRKEEVSDDEGDPWDEDDFLYNTGR